LTSDEKPSGLVRAIGRWSLTALVLNSIIGSGIFGLPSVVAGLVGRASVFAYLVAAAGVGVIMACFAEVGSRFRAAGGPYLYAREAFGRFAGIEIAWLAWLVRLTAAAANANLFVLYLAEFWAPATQRIPRLVVLTLLVGVLAAVNYRGVSAGAQLSNVFAAAKILSLGVFVGVGAFFLRASPAPASSSATSGAWLDAVLVLVFVFGGFEAALIPMGEVKDPRRDVPFSLFTALIVTTVLYTLIQVVVMGVLAAPQRTDRPLAAAAAVFLGQPGAALMTLGALVSVYGYLSGMMLNTPRLTFALAEREDFPPFLAAVHPRFRTPHVSIVLFGLLVWGLAVVGTFRWNLTLSAVARLFTYASTCAAVLALRKKWPTQAAFRLPAGPVFAVLGVAFTLVVVTRMGRAELLIIAATAAIALVNWLWTRRRFAPPRAD
jgi:APA family basic amino acid/polyamine antiporter